MKGLQGITIAAALGVVGAFCNWMYLAQKAENLDTTAFTIVNRDVQLNPGDEFRAEHFAPVEVPQANKGNLEQIAIPWVERSTIVGYAARKSYRGGELILRQDVLTPPRRDLAEMLAEDEAVRWVPVDPRSFVAEHVNPGDRVSFIVPQVSGEPASVVESSRGVRSLDTQILGPFEVLALGTRKGRREILEAEGQRPAQENVVAIRVELKNGGLDEKSARLFELLRLTNHQAAEVMLHSTRMEGE